MEFNSASAALSRAAVSLVSFLLTDLSILGAKAGGRALAIQAISSLSLKQLTTTIFIHYVQLIPLYNIA
jgi:hypothetical protein